jgi:competence protein ComEA
MQFSPSRFVKALALVALMAAVAGTAAHAAEGGAPPVDINQASVAELASLPGIGESKAKAIVEHRSAEPFQSVEDLKKVKGIGERTFESLRPSITVGGGGQPK